MSNQLSRGEIIGGSLKLLNDTHLQYQDTTLSTAQILALNATPQTVVTAPGAGKCIVFVGAELFLDYNSAAYAGVAAGEDLAFKVADSSGSTVATVEATGFIDQTADGLRYVHPSTTAYTLQANQPLVIHMLTGEVITGNSPIYVRTFFRVVPSTLS